MEHTTWNRVQASAFVCRLKLNGYKVLELAEGWCTEVDGLQIFRATHMGNERFDIRYDGRVFLDV